MDVPGPAVAELGRAARSNKIYLIIGVIEREGEMAETIHNRERENDAEFAENRVGQNRSEERQKIDGRHERMVPGFGIFRTQFSPNRIDQLEPDRDMAH